ncbi:uncharacterized protein LOC131011382 [Salvia miltiorrhiza]|uniref:uncharacterized protein LOC131011382 n=1 Tax=Salvia miltiorrhiza TaxID=226208 RepID=UPI0025AD3944|nr:uncharacterized protein LOC131011382 [Salvia miltiorrhiza]
MAENRESSKLNNDERNQVAQWLLQRSSNGKLQYGAKKEAATLFKLSLKTIYLIWKSATAQQALGRPIQLKSMKRGSTHKDKWAIDSEKVKKLSVLQRSSIRVMACNLGVSKSLVGVWVKDKKLRAHTNAIKPLLTPQNKISRLRWSLRQLSDINVEGFIKFQTMFNTIHIDEKWFYLTKSKDRYYLMPGELDPYRACKSNRYIPKIMFSCASARPIKAKGDNNYKIPHMNKERLERIGMLPDAISISQQLVDESMEFLEGNNHADTTEYTDGQAEEFQQNMSDILEGLTHVNIN